MSTSMIQSNDSDSEANSRPFQGGPRANSGSEAVNPSHIPVVMGSTNTEMDGTSMSLAASNDVRANPKRRRSDPKSWKKNEIKTLKAQGMPIFNKKLIDVKSKVMVKRY